MKRLTIYLALIFCALSSVCCRAQTPRMYVTHLLSRDFSKADVILIARIDKVGALVPDVKTMTPQIYNYLPLSLECSAVKYLKGDVVVKTVDLNLPEADGFYYQGLQLFGKPGSYVLLVLQAASNGVLSPVSPEYPFIPLGNAVPNTAQIDSSDPMAASTEVITDAMADKSLRSFLRALFILENNDAVVKGLSKYVNDPDKEVRVSVLVSMITCQQVAAIPLMVKYLHENSDYFVNNSTDSALRYYNTPKAIPALCPLTFDPVPGIREAALHALVHTESPASTPFIILSLMEPDLKHNIHGAAWDKLTNQLPETFPTSEYSLDELNTSSMKCFNFYEKWWRMQLSTKPSETSHLYRLPLIISPAYQTDPIAVTLFSPYPQTREAACAGLAAHYTDGDSGYLVLALDDPDSKVSFTAYSTLRRLALADSKAAPLVGSMPTSDQYISESDKYNAAIYKWWQDRLQPSK